MRRLFRCVTATLTLCAGLMPATAAPLDRQRLIQAFPLPSVEVSIGFELTPAVLTEVEPGDPKSEIERLRKAMTGTPADAEAHQRIGLLLQKLDVSEEATSANKEAARLFRLRLGQEPPSSALMAQLGTTLLALDEREAAERVLRTATELGTPHWTAWSSLGSLKQARAFQSLTGTPGMGVSLPTPKSSAENERLLQLLKGKNPSAAQLEQAAKELQEARKCYDRAVAVAPEEPRAYAERATARLSIDLTNALIAEARKGRSLADAFAGLQSRISSTAMLAPEFLADMQQVSRLRPEDARLIAFTTFFQVVGDFMRRGEAPDFEDGHAWKRMPEPLRKAVNGNLNRLELLGASKSKGVAASAWQSLGALQLLIVGDAPLAEKCLRRALKLDGSLERAWDLLLVCKLNAGKLPEITAVAEERVKAHDSAHNRLFLAKALHKAGNIRRALEEARAALKLEPMGFATNVAVAVLLLQKGEAEVLPEVMARLDQAGVSPQITNDQRGDVIAILAGMLALGGNMAEARDNLNKLLEKDPSHQVATAILAALGTP